MEGLYKKKKGMEGKRLLQNGIIKFQNATELNAGSQKV